MSDYDNAIKFRDQEPTPKERRIKRVAITVLTLVGAAFLAIVIAALKTAGVLS